MTSAERIELLNQTDPAELCTRTLEALQAFARILNEETTLLRAGNLKAAGELSARKGQLGQDYVVLARTVQRQTERLQQTAPDSLAKLATQHESLALQMAENLRVLASARDVTENLLSDVAKAVGSKQGPKVYGAQGILSTPKDGGIRGLSVNRAL